MKKRCLCAYLTVVLPALFATMLNVNNTQSEIDNSWLLVPWSNGGHYYHNTITKEDRDEL